MTDDPFFIKLLQRLGVNTTKLKWKLYQIERRAQSAARNGVTPTWLRWLSYPHKICRHCGAVNDRDTRICHRCERRLPGMLGYRLFRMLGLALPQGTPVTSMAFIVVILFFYGLAVVFDGFSAILSPSSETLYAFGAFTERHGINLRDWWRLFAFSLAHGGIIHIGFNVIATSQIGPVIENYIGRKRLLVVITACQLAAALATYVWYNMLDQRAVFLTIGASGWVFGLIGFGVAYFHQAGQRAHHYRNMLLHWAVYALLFGLIIRANNAAHIGGMVGGALMALLPESPRRATRLTDPAWEAAFWVCLALWSVVLGYMALSIASSASAMLAS